MNTIVADACPVIFLAKLNQLELVRGVFPGKILLPDAVARELEQENIPLAEQRRIRGFLKKCQIETVRSPQYASTSLSLADRCVLTLAGKHRDAIILTDDGLVRRIARSEGFTVAGTLGVLIRARRAGLIAKSIARQALNDLIARHQFRISIELFQDVLRYID